MTSYNTHYIKNIKILLPSLNQEPRTKEPNVLCDGNENVRNASSLQIRSWGVPRQRSSQDLAHYFPRTLLLGASPS